MTDEPASPSQHLRALSLLSLDSQLSDFYLQFHSLFDSTLSLIYFLLSLLSSGLFLTPQRLGLAFVLCQICEDPNLFDAIGQYWAFQPCLIEQLLLYELVVEKNFREFISLKLSQIEERVLFLSSGRGMSEADVFEQLDRILAGVGFEVPVVPVVWALQGSFEPRLNSTFFNSFDPVNELKDSEKKAHLPQVLKPNMLLPLPEECPSIPLEIPLIITSLQPVPNPCMDNKLYISTTIYKLPNVSVEEQNKLLEVIRNYPDLLESEVLAEKVEKIVNEAPDFCFELLKTLRKHKKEAFER